MIRRVLSFLSYAKKPSTLRGPLDRKAKMLVESLEDRQLLSVSPIGSGVMAPPNSNVGSGPFAVIGTVYNDTNRNGTQDANEAGIANAKVYFDDNSNGKRDANEGSMFTGQDGFFHFYGVQPGEHLLRVDRPGWEATQVGKVSLSYEDPQYSTGVGIAPSSVQAVGAVHGSIFRDSNRDGWNDFMEKGLANKMVFADANENGRLDAGEISTRTDADGNYELELPVGDHVLRVGDQAISDTLVVTVEEGEVLEGLDIAVNPGANLQGFLYLDQNANGQRDAEDFGLNGPNSVVYLDLNHNGLLEENEPTTTCVDGHFEFTEVQPGEYTVRAKEQEGLKFAEGEEGYTISTSEGETIQGFQFGLYVPGSIRGLVQHDSNTAPSGGPGVAWQGVYQDLNDNGQFDVHEPLAFTDEQGWYNLEGVRPGDVNLRLLSIGGWYSTLEGASQKVSVESGASTTARQFFVQPGMNINDVNVVEGHAGYRYAEFTVSLEAPAQVPVTVQYATQGGSAMMGQDFTRAMGTVTFKPGEQTKTIRVRITGDRFAEADEQFTVQLQNARGAALIDGFGVGTIKNDDGSRIAPPWFGFPIGVMPIDPNWGFNPINRLPEELGKVHTFTIEPSLRIPTSAADLGLINMVKTPVQATSFVGLGNSFNQLVSPFFTFGI